MKLSKQKLKNKLRTSNVFGAAKILAQRAFKVSPHKAKDELIKLFPHSAKIVVFDVGAHDGSSSLHYSQWWPKAKFELFEPLEFLRKKASSSFALENRTNQIRIHECIASNENGHAKFFISEYNDRDGIGGSSSLLEPHLHLKEFPHVKFDKSKPMKTCRLDSLIEEGLIQVPHFIHLDVQGAELMVLQGLGIYIDQVQAIWMEVERKELYKGQPLIDEVSKFMLKAGFQLKVDTVEEVYGDQLWTQRDY